MNFQRFGYGAPKYYKRTWRLPGGTVMEPENTIHAHREAKKLGWVSRADSASLDTTFYNSFDKRQNFLLPYAKVVEFVTEPKPVEINKDFFLHHMVLHNHNLNERFINIMELHIDFNIQLFTTSTLLQNFEVWLVLVPDPYNMVRTRVHNGKNAEPTQTNEIYYVANENLKDMSQMEEEIYYDWTAKYDEDKHKLGPDYPYAVNQMNLLHRYAIDKKYYAKMASNRDGIKKIHFKFKANRRVGDILLKDGEAIFVIVRGFATGGSREIGEVGFSSCTSVNYTIS